MNKSDVKTEDAVKDCLKQELLKRGFKVWAANSNRPRLIVLKHNCYRGLIKMEAMWDLSN